MPRAVWGIDLSKYTIKGVKLELTKTAVIMTSIDIYQYNSTPVESSQVYDLLLPALISFKHKNKIGSTPVCISLPTHSTFNRIIKIPPVSPAMMATTIKGEAQSSIPFPLTEVIWGYQLVNRDYQPDEDREVIIFAIRKELIEEFLSMLQRARLNIDLIQFAPVGLYNFITFDQQPGEACLAMDIGVDNTDFVVIENSKLWIRNLPITGETFTKAIQQKFSLSYADAEDLKIKAPKLPEVQKIYSCLQPVYRDLLTEIQRSVGYYKSISKVAKFSRMFLLGKASKAINLGNFLKQGLGIPVQGITHLKNIQIADVINISFLQANLDSISTAIGLALQGLGRTINKTNLLPEAYIAKRETRKKQPILIVAGLILGLIFLVAGIKFKNEAVEFNTYQEKLSALQARVLQTRNQVDAASVMTEEIGKATVLKQLAAIERDTLINVLNHILSRIPENEKINNPNENLWILDWQIEKKTETVKEENKEIVYLRVLIELAISKRSGEEAVRFVKNKLNTEELEKQLKNILRGVIEVSYKDDCALLLPSDTKLHYDISARDIPDERDMEQKYSKLYMSFEVKIGECQIIGIKGS